MRNLYKKQFLFLNHKKLPNTNFYQCFGVLLFLTLPFLTINLSAKTDFQQTVINRTICAGESITLTHPVNGANWYFWNTQGGSTRSIIVSPKRTTHYKVSAHNGGHYKFVVTVRDCGNPPIASCDEAITYLPIQNNPLVHFDFDECVPDGSFNEFGANVSNNGCGSITNFNIGQTFIPNQWTQPDLNWPANQIHGCDILFDDSRTGTDKILELSKDKYICSSDYNDAKDEFFYIEFTTTPNGKGLLTGFQMNMNLFHYWVPEPQKLYIRILQNGQEVYLNNNISLPDYIHYNTPELFFEEFELEYTGTTTFRVEFNLFDHVSDPRYDDEGVCFYQTYIDDVMFYGGCRATTIVASDLDGDGICDEEDCSPLDGNFPKPIGSACNDGNPNTINDVIQGDGCNCLGVSAERCNEEELLVFYDLDDCANSVGNSNVLTPSSSNASCINISNVSNFRVTNHNCFGQFGTSVHSCPSKSGDNGAEGSADAICWQGNAQPFFNPIAGECSDDPQYVYFTFNASSFGEGQLSSLSFYVKGTDIFNRQNARKIGVQIRKNGGIVFQQDDLPMGDITRWKQLVVDLSNDPDLGLNNSAQYEVRIQGYDTDGIGLYDPVWEIDQVRIFGICGDNDTDNDGLCNDEDCAPNNPNLPTIPGTACNDGDFNTINDVIQADGCSCEGIIAPKATVGNLVFNDANNNGIKDSGESGIPNIEVKLLNANGTLLATQNTNTSGFYEFTNLSQGSYKIMFGTPNGFTASPRTGFGDNDVDNNNDNNPNNGNMTDVFFLSSGENNRTIDAGFFAGPICDNLNYGGKIGFGNICSGTVEVCGSNTIPSIDNCDLPSGGSGAIEYIWLKNEISCDGPTGTVAQMLANPGAYNWKIIPNSTNSSYTPSNLTTSTCFLRCARRAGCDIYFGESNIVRIEINEDCGGGGGTTESCGNGTSITYGNGSISMEGGSFYQVLDANWNEVFNCGWNCGYNQTASNLTAGSYRVYIKDENYVVICEKVITLSGGGQSGSPCDNQGGDSDGDGICDNQDNCKYTANADQADNDGDGIGNVCDDTPNGGGSGGGGNTGGTCTDVTATGGAGSVTISNIPTAAKIEISGPSTGWGLQIVCEGNCNETAQVDNLTEGVYSIKIQTFNPYCYAQIEVTVMNGGGSNGSPCDNQGGDSDGDGICDTQDNCKYTANADQADNDGDGIGNVCDNTPNGGGSGGGGNTSGTCTDVTATGSAGSVTIFNIPTAAKVEISGPSTGWALQVVCEGNCNETAQVDNLTEGVYSIKIQTFNPYCYAQIEVTVTSGGGSGGSPCDNQGGDSDGDGICDNQDNCKYTANADQADNDSDGIGNVCDDTPNGSGNEVCGSFAAETQLIHWDMIQCQADYSFDEFVPNISNSNCLTVSNTKLGTTYDERTGNHPVEASFAGRIHECNGSGENTIICFFQDVYGSTYEEVKDAYNYAEFTVTPDGCGQIAKFEIRHNVFEYGNGTPSRYYLRVLKNGQVIFLDEDVLLTSPDYQTDIFDFTDNPEFAITSPTTFRFEFLPYDDNGPQPWNMFEVDDIIVYGACESATGGNNNGNQVSCGDITITYGEGIIDMQGQAGQSYYFKINDLDNGWAQVFGCGWNCGAHQTATGLPNGKYLVTISNADWSKHCDLEIEMTNSSYTSGASSRNAPQLAFEAYNADRAVDLQWLTNSGYKVEHFEVERSTDGQNFESLQKSINKKWGDQLAYHHTIDLNPIKGINYYRVKEVYLDGSFVYTDVKEVNYNIDLDKLAIYPNPVEKVLNLNLKPVLGKSTTINIVNTFGQIVQKQPLGIVDQENAQIELNSSIPNGFYQVLLEVEGQKPITRKLVIKRLY